MSGEVPALGLFRAHGHADGCAHAQGAFQAVHRRQGAQGVAADIAKDVQLELFEHMEGGAMGAAGAKHRRAGGQGRLLGGFFPAEGLADALDTEFALAARIFFALHGDAHGGDLLLQDALQLLNDHQLVHLCGEIPHGLAIQRIAEAQLQDAGLGQGFPDKLIHHARAHHAQGGTAHFHAVQAQGGGVPLHAGLAFLHIYVALAGHAGHHDIFHHVLFIGLDGHVHALRHFHRGPLMGQPGGEAQDKGRVVFFAQFKGFPGKILAFLAVGGLQHGHVGRPGDHARVLLVLAGMHKRIVRHKEHQAAVDAGIGRGVQRVRRHVQSHMLHAAHGPGPRHGRAEGRLHGHLFIGRPLAQHFGISGTKLRDFGAGCPRIAGDEPHPRLIRAPRDGFIAKHQFFHQTLTLL